MSRRKGKVRKLNPTFFVFCEGETEEEYVKMLKRKYRLSIQIKAKVTGTNISQQLITRALREYDHHRDDQVFLMYDRDRADINQKLDNINNATVIGTLPAIELWFLLHYQRVRSTLSSDASIGKLLEIWNGYQKGKLSEDEQNALWERTATAVANAEGLPNDDCDSFSSIGLFINVLDRVKSSK